MKFDEEEDLLKSGQSLRCELIKIAHHGNSDATSPALIEAVSPVVAVVSTDSDARPELPDPRIVALLEARGVPLVSTWRSGGGVLVTLAGKDTARRPSTSPRGPFLPPSIKFAAARTFLWKFRVKYTIMMPTKERGVGHGVF
jgi:hypothetical protein